MASVAPARWFVATTPRPGAAVRLFCFPNAGGSATVFRGWGETLTEVEVLAARLPGRHPRFGEPVPRSMPALIEEARDALHPFLDRPFALLGHSLGAIIAFELARALRDDGLPPCHLFVCGSRAPHLPRPGRRYANTPDAELIERLRTFDGTPPEILANPEMLELFLPVIRADLAISESYRFTAGEPLPCPITAFGGSEDEFITRNDLQDWMWHTRTHFEVKMMPGRHFFLHDSPDALLDEIGRALRGRLT